MSFNLKIVTPNGEFYNGDCSLLSVKTTEGYVTILPNHMPIVTMVEIAPLEFVNNKEIREVCACSNGMLYVNRQEVTLLVRSIEYKNDIDLQRAKEALERAKERLAIETFDVKRAELAYQRALNRIDISSK